MATGSGRLQQLAAVRSSRQTPCLCSCRLSRVSGDGHREPMLPCILEGLPSRDSDVTMACPPALDELLGRSSQTCKLQHMSNGDSAAHLSAKVAAVWPQSLLIPPSQLPSSDSSATVPKGSPEPPKGSAAVLRGSPDSSKGSPTCVIGSFGSVKGTAPHGKPPVSPKSKPASVHSDVAIGHCFCSDIQSYIRSQHFPPSQYVAGIAALPHTCPPYNLFLLGSVNLAFSFSLSICPLHSRLRHAAFVHAVVSLFCCWVFSSSRGYH